jgi:hypothetical protein
VTLTKNNGITLKIQNDEQSARKHILTVHIGAGHTKPTNNSTPAGSIQDRAETQSLLLHLQNSAEQLQLQNQQFPKSPITNCGIAHHVGVTNCGYRLFLAGVTNCGRFPQILLLCRVPYFKKIQYEKPIHFFKSQLKISSTNAT